MTQQTSAEVKGAEPESACSSTCDSGSHELAVESIICGCLATGSLLPAAARSADVCVHVSLPPPPVGPGDTRTGAGADVAQQQLQM